MKLLALLLVVAAVTGQDFEDTVTEGLLRSQAQLAIGHEFFEMIIVESRTDLSGFVQNDSIQLINSHLDAYDELKTIAFDTTAAIDALPSTPAVEQCLDAVKNRWEIQISRAGQRLSQCIARPIRRIRAWDNYLNSISSTGHLTSNLVQNQGVAVLSDTEDFIDQWEIPALINRQFRQILSDSLPFYNLFEDFLKAVEENGAEAIEILLRCDRDIVEAFEAEASLDLTRARNCIPS